MKTLLPISLFVIFFSSCSQPKENNTKSETPKEDSTKTSASENNAKAFKSFALRLDEIGLPTTLAVDHGDLTLNPFLTDEQMKLFAPIELDENEGYIYAFGKMTKGEVTGILYYYNYIPKDPEDHDEVSGEIYLAVYDTEGKLIDYILAGIQNYGSGHTYMKSWDKIIYFFHSEMEFITLTTTIYSLQGTEFKKLSEENQSFGSGEEGYDKYLDYIDKMME